MGAAGLTQPYHFVVVVEEAETHVSSTHCVMCIRDSFWLLKLSLFIDEALLYCSEWWDNICDFV
jgi:hypothetical protein